MRHRHFYWLQRGIFLFLFLLLPHFFLSLVDPSSFIMSMVCHNRKCNNHAQDLLNCWVDECNNRMHASCSKLLLDFHQIPNEQRPDDSSIVFCKKGCYNKWIAHEKKEKRAAEKLAKESIKKSAKFHGNKISPCLC